MNANATPLALPKPDLSKASTMPRPPTAGAIHQSSPLVISLPDAKVAKGTQGLSGAQPLLRRVRPQRSDHRGNLRRPQATPRRQRRDVLGPKQLAAALPSPLEREDRAGDAGPRAVSKLSNQPMYSKPQDILPFVVEARDAVIERLRTRSNVRHAWLIAMAPRKQERRAYEEDGAEIVVMATPAEECLRRIAAAPGRENWHDWETLVNDWWASYEE